MLSYIDTYVSDFAAVYLRLEALEDSETGEPIASPFAEGKRWPCLAALPNVVYSTRCVNVLIFPFDSFSDGNGPSLR